MREQHLDPCRGSSKQQDAARLGRVSHAADRRTGEATRVARPGGQFVTERRRPRALGSLIARRCNVLSLMRWRSNCEVHKLSLNYTS
jgi:hypothetical protein